MSPRKYITEEPPHLEQYLLNLENQGEAPRPTRSHAQSRITALIGTHHSRQDELGEELCKLCPKAAAPKSIQQMFGRHDPVESAQPNADQFSVVSDVLWIAFSKALKKVRPNLLSTDTMTSLRKGKKDFIGDLTFGEYVSILDSIATELEVHSPFQVPAMAELSGTIESLLLSNDDDSTIATGYQGLENGTHPLLEPKWLVGDILKYVDGMICQHSTGDPSNGIEEAQRLTAEEVIQHFESNVAEMLIIDRAALDDRRTFWNTTIATLYQEEPLDKRLSNFIWRSGQQIAEFLINVYTRIPLFRATDSHNSEMGTVKLLVRNLGRKHAQHQEDKAPSGPKKYILIWVNRGSGWRAQPSEESPLFNALVHHLNDEGYLRDVPYRVAIHLVITGRGDTRYILDNLGIDSSGHHFRTQCLDLGRLPADSACELLDRYLIPHLIEQFDAQFRRYFNKYCDRFFERLQKKYANTSKEDVTDRLCPSLTADLANFFLNQRIRYVGPQHAQVNRLTLIDEFYRVTKNKSLFARAHRRQLKESITRFHEQYIAKGLAQPTGQRGDPDAAETSPLDSHFRLFDWRQPKMLCILARVMRHVVYKSAKQIAFVAYRETMRQHFRRSCAFLYQSNTAIFDDDWSLPGFKLDEWDFSKLLRQQLDPILLQDAEEVLSDLEKVDCTEVARRVAVAFKERFGEPRLADNTTVLNAFDVRNIVEGALKDALRASSEAPSNNLGAGTHQQQSNSGRLDSRLGNQAHSSRVGNGTVDRAIANLLAADFLETIYYRPYKSEELRPVAGASRYAGKLYRIINPLVVEKLCD